MNANLSSSTELDQISRNLLAKGKIDRRCAAARPWNELFSSLYLAESAAAQHAECAAEFFQGRKNKESESFYRQMSKEEKGHACLVGEMIGQYYEPSGLTKSVYSGQKCRLSDDFSQFERLVVVHQVFEPSALAILSFLRKHADEFFEESWSNVIQLNAVKILQEESLHIKQGRKLISGMMSNITPSMTRSISHSIRTHQRFITSGIKRFFANTHYDNVIPQLHSRLDVAFSSVPFGDSNENS